MPDPIGVLRVQTFYNGARHEEEIFVVVPSTEWDAKLYEYEVKGNQLAPTTISTGYGLRITITNSIIASIQGTGPLVIGFSGKIERALLGKE
jgi:hypothetical protein